MDSKDDDDVKEFLRQANSFHGTTGETVETKRLPKKYRKRVEKFGTKTIKGYDPNFKFG